MSEPGSPLPAVERIVAAVRREPGIHFRRLGQRAAVSSAGHLEHHVERLLRAGVLAESREGRYRCFFVAGVHDARDRARLARFAKPRVRAIAGILLDGPLNRTQLALRLGWSDATLGYHLDRLVTAGDVRKERGPNCQRYSLADPAAVRDLLNGARIPAGRTVVRKSAPAQSGATAVTKSTRGSRLVH